MDIFYDIQNYILFLRQNNYYLSFSDFSNNFYPYTEKLLQHEIHLHSICSYLKSNPETTGLCQRNKAKLSKCKISHPVYSCCYAGVEEYVFPIHCKGKRIICIHISGYRNNLKHSSRLKEKLIPHCTPIFEELYSQLSTQKPSIKTVESFVKPLEYMLKQLYLHCQANNEINAHQSTAEQIYLKCLQFINDNYMKDITAKTIAENMQYSASYIRSTFKKYGGVSLQNKINQTRLENAVFLLKNTNMSITEIAFHCGFSDSNYFSVIFKKVYKSPPLSFRKSQNSA